MMRGRNSHRILALVLTLTVLLSISPGGLAFGRPTELIPVGRTVGIDIKCNGVMVVGIGEVATEKGSQSPGIQAGLLPGDVITRVGEKNIRSAAEFMEAVAAAGAEEVRLQVLRAGEGLSIAITPVQSLGGRFELGLWLREGMAGIGTVTFYDPENGIFGALGHGVSDVETGALVPLGEGFILSATVKAVRRGTAGAPGELQGEFDFSKTIGSLYANTATGIFGRAGEADDFGGREALPIGADSDLELGAAQILANVRGGETEAFDIEISRIFSGGDDRNMMITVTDPALIDLTGGIVQGMSGSPIVQKGKIIGAVTHVLINNPEKGYGISIDSMLSQAYTGESGELGSSSDFSLFSPGHILTIYIDALLMV